MPGLCVYLFYAALVHANRVKIFGKNHVAQFFRQDLMDGTLRFPLRKPEVIVLGDSGAKVGLSPRDFDGPFMVNLAALYGNAITAFEAMDSYLQKYDPPKCMAFVSQYEWRRSYAVFFSTLVRDRALTGKELAHVWNETRAHNLYPATEFSFARFWWNYAKQGLYVDSSILSRLHLAFPWPFPSQEWENAMVHLEKNRGQVGRSNPGQPNDDLFFREDVNMAFVSPFVPHPTEDHYLLKLAELAAAKNINLFVGALPVAESEMADKNAIFRSGRRAHFEKLFAGKTGVYLLNFPGTLPREYFSDFTHPNAKGSDFLTAGLAAQLNGLCQTGE